MNNLFSSGSPVITITLLLLILLSVTTWSIALYKLWRQVRDGQHNRTFNETFWASPDWNSAAELAQRSKGDLAQLSQAGFAEVENINREQHDLQHQGLPREVLESMLRRQVHNIQRYHERGLAELATIGSTAPFIGLFGTVWGIMHALQGIGQSGSASLDIVAGPIGEALVATAIGIATALPAVLAYNFFLRRLRVHLTDLENFAHDFMRLALKNTARQ